MGDFDGFLDGPFMTRSDGYVSVGLPAGQRQMIENLLSQLREMMTTDDPALVRLFPPPYGDDEERNRGYAVLAGAELVERRIARIDSVLQSINSEQLTVEELEQWMRAVNDLRLVLCTALDITEDEQDPPEEEPALSMYMAYEHLGYLLERMVRVLSD